jgi:hypothetical protein
MYIYIYIYIYTHTYIYIHTNTHICTRTHACDDHVCICVDAGICTHGHTDTHETQLMGTHLAQSTYTQNGAGSKVSTEQVLDSVKTEPAGLYICIYIYIYIYIYASR